MDQLLTAQIAGVSLEALELRATETLNQLYQFELRCRSHAAGPAPSQLVNTIGQLEINDGLGHSRTLSGLVTEARREIFDDSAAIVTLTLRPQVYPLTLGRNCRVFLDSTVVDIAGKVLAGVPHRLQLSRSYATRSYCAQYREDDWRFLCRLMEEEGIYYWFDHSAGGQLVLADDSSLAPQLSGGGQIAFHDQATMRRDRELIDAMGFSAQLTANAFAVKSVDPEHPELPVQGSSGGGMLEHYDAPGGGPLTADECARQCQLKAAAALAASGGISGSTSSVRLEPGRVLLVGGHPLAGHDGGYLLTSVQVHIDQPHGGDASETPSYRCLFTAISAATGFAPARVTPPARQSGVQSGVVGGAAGQEIHPDERGRVRVQLHWDREGTRDDQSGTWMRVAQRGAASSLQVPRVGWNVMTFNDEGAVDAPSVLSRLVDGEHPPPYKLPDHKTRVVFKTATTPIDGSFNEIHYEDAKGRELMHLNASRDMNTLVGNDHNERVLRDARHQIGRDHSLLVGSDSVTMIGNDQSVEIYRDVDEGVGEDSATIVGQNATLTIAGDRDVKVGAARSIKVTGRRDLTVGTALVDACIGSISGNSQLVTMLVGGAQLKAAYKGISDKSDGISLQTIAGAKIELTKKGRGLKVKKRYFETVGGALVIKTGASFSDRAVADATWKVGGLVVTSAAKLSIVATEQIEIKCGQSALVITKDGVEVRAPELDIAKASLLQVESPRIEHN